MDILIFGDSITQGAFDAECGGWANRLGNVMYRRALDSGLEKRDLVFNLGISGDNSEKLKLRFLSETQARTDGECAIIIAIGVNDSQYEVATDENRVHADLFRENMKQLASDAKKYSKKVFFVGIAPIEEEKLSPMPWKPTHAYDNKNITIYNKILEDVSKEEGVLWVSMNGVFGEALTSCLVDGIHPSAHGHKLMFERIKNALENENVI